MNRTGACSGPRKSVVPVTVLAAVLLTLGGNAAHATLAFYTDRPSFDAVVPGLPIEDFEEGQVSAEGVIGCPAPLDSSSNNTCFLSGEILEGVSIQDSPGPDSDGLALFGGGFLGAPSKAIAANYFVESLDLLFPNSNVTAVGMDLVQVAFASADTYTITIYGIEGELGTTTALATAAGPFWGVISDQIITRINIFSPTGQAEAIDNLVFGSRIQSVTPTQTFDPFSASPTPTPTSGGVGQCGNGIVDSGEDCDDGGTCIGGANAGTHCTAESQCLGAGVCVGGTKMGYSCLTSSDCPGAICTHCVPQGGDGCAENCTNETEVPFTLQPGAVDDIRQDLISGTSGTVVHGNLQIPLPLTGSESLTIGEERDGTIPLVVKAASVHFPRIDVMGLACDCERGVAVKTCGGTAFRDDGSLARDCTPGFATDTLQDGPCPVDLPCAFVHGPGNSATGIISCQAGLQGIDIAVTQDDANAATACTSDAQCAGLPGSSTCIDDPDNRGTKLCSATPASQTASGTGSAGAAILLNSIAMGQKIGSCAIFPNFCRSTDPFSDQRADRGAISTAPLTTGASSGEFTTATGIRDNTVCQCTDPDFLTCSLNDCANPWTIHGAQFDCPALSIGNVSGAALAGTFTVPHIPIVGDSVVSSVFVAGPGPLNTPLPSHTSALTPAASQTPTPSAIRTLPTPTATPSAVQTPTPTATPPFGVPRIDLGSGAARPGGVACVPAVLSSAAMPVGGTANDIGFDPTLFLVSGCSINPAIGAGTAPDKQLIEFSQSSGLERVGIFGFNANQIPDGTLYACTVLVGGNVPSGPYNLSNVASASDLVGNDLSNVGGAAGHIVVTTCTGDCNGNGSVSIGEVIKCVRMFLGQGMCDPATPSLSCPVADADLNGSVSIGEVIQCSNRFLMGCF